MKIIPLAHQVIGKLALISLLFSPFALTPSYAAELVGKPVAVGAQPAGVASAAASGQAQTAQNTIAPAPIVVERASLVPVPVPVPIPILAPDLPSEPPAATDFSSHHGDIRDAINEVRDDLHHEMPSSFGSIALNPETIIPIVAMLLLFGGPVLLLIILAILHYRAKARRQQNINMNIDKLLAAGRDIPVEMLLGEEVALKAPVRAGMVAGYSNDNYTMQKGVRNIGLGTGWLLFLTIMFGIKIGAFGFIFIGLGISQLVIWKLSGASVSATAKAEAPETFRAQD